MSGALNSARRRLGAGLIVAGVLAPLLLAAAQWPSYWLWIASEQTPMTWLQSVVLVLAAATSLLVAVLLRLRDASRSERLPWLLLAAGFAALAVDERFALHERIRDGFLAPRGVRIPLLPWVAPGDFLVLLIALSGLALLPRVLRALAPDRSARRLFVLGVVLASAAVATDSIDPSTWSVAAERLQQSLEEVVELCAGLAMLGGVALRLLALLDHASSPVAPASTQIPLPAGSLSGTS